MRDTAAAKITKHRAIVIQRLKRCARKFVAKRITKRPVIVDWRTPFDQCSERKSFAGMQRHGVVVRYIIRPRACATHLAFLHNVKGRRITRVSGKKLSAFGVVGELCGARQRNERCFFNLRKRRVLA